MKALWVILLISACGTVPPLNGEGSSGGAGSDGGNGGDPGSGDPGSGDPGGGSGSGSTTDLYRSGTRIKMKMLTSPDGAKVFQTNYDSQRQEDCSFFNFQTSDGVVRCLPAIANLSSGVFADATCSVSVVLSLTCSPAPKYIATLQQPTCPASFMWGPIYAATPVSISTIFRRSGTNCVSAPVPTDYSVFGVTGPEIPPSSFQAATVTIE